jgi:hypothetical protein
VKNIIISTNQLDFSVASMFPSSPFSSTPQTTFSMRSFVSNDVNGASISNAVGNVNGVADRMSSTFDSAEHYRTNMKPNDNRETYGNPYTTSTPSYSQSQRLSDSSHLRHQWRNSTPTDHSAMRTLSHFEENQQFPPTPQRNEPVPAVSNAHIEEIGENNNFS